ATAVIASNTYGNLQINSNFDGGSIGTYTIDNENNEIYFTLKHETFANRKVGYTYWVNFKVTGVFGEKIVFHVTNTDNAPFFRDTEHESQMVYSCDSENWRRLTDHYCSNNSLDLVS
ncbi:MAG: M14-type cytosolic carboxypeptidase, partial [Bacteroidales bacterium]|nr:M14-type cytosolic carboxypeptidase [Bacteroidales bacterium]